MNLSMDLSQKKGLTSFDCMSIEMKNYSIDSITFQMALKGSMSDLWLNIKSTFTQAFSVHSSKMLIAFLVCGHLNALISQSYQPVSQYTMLD